MRKKFKFTKLRSGRDIFGFIYECEKSLEELMIKLERQRKKVIFYEET